MGFGSNRFRINNNGTVFTSVELSRLERASYTLVVIVSDRGSPLPLLSYTLLNVTISPQFVRLVFDEDPYRVSKEEEVSDLFLVTVHAFEEGTMDDDEVRYMLTGTVSPPSNITFSVDELTGLLELTQPLDAEVVSTISVEIRAYSLKTSPTILPATTFVIITVININDVAPVISCPPSIRIREELPSGTSCIY